MAKISLKSLSINFAIPKLQVTDVTDGTLPSPYKAFSHLNSINGPGIPAREVSGGAYANTISAVCDSWFPGGAHGQLR
jgi:hypothetical protein